MTNTPTEHCLKHSRPHKAHLFLCLVEGRQGHQVALKAQLLGVQGGTHPIGEGQMQTQDL